MTNINIGIIDQQLTGILQRHGTIIRERFNIGDDVKLRSMAFVLLCVKVMLDLSEEEALDRLTDGGQDMSVDAIDVEDVLDGEFVVTLFQGKYAHNLDKSEARNFPGNDITKLIGSIGALFDPMKPMTLNDDLERKVENVRSLINDGYIPKVNVLCCNNGLVWLPDAQQAIDNSGYADQVTWEHVNHDKLVSIMSKTQKVNDTLRLTGKAVVEDFQFKRVMIGRVAVGEVAALFRTHGDKLLERNVRRYLGIQGNRVNEAIQRTLSDVNERDNFYFYNNGITIVCEQFRHNSLQGQNLQVQLTNMQVINGGQTCKTIEQVLSGTVTDAGDATVLVRVYELPTGDTELVKNITYATNSQNPVDLRDLRSNDGIQARIALSVEQLGFNYRRQRSDVSTRPIDITSATAAEALLSVWMKKPHQAKFMSREHFGKLYHQIFHEKLNGAQLIIATLLYRIAENKRKRPPAGAPEFVSYASCFLAMQMGRFLLHDLGIKQEQLDHAKFQDAQRLVETKGEYYFEKSVSSVDEALKALYPGGTISLQRLSATFRRGDLISILLEQAIA